MALEKIFRDFIHFAQCNELKIEGIAIADTDRVILEHRFTPDQERNIYSHTKSYMSMAAGIAIEEESFLFPISWQICFLNMYRKMQIHACWKLPWRIF